jgi:ring-1,2-phenylacetyl-CoA epoxidase subunit PaaE
VTLRAVLDGTEVRRTYSICSPPSQHRLRIAVKRLEGGLFSRHAHEALHVGDTVEVMPPGGGFVVRPDPGAARHHVAIAAGSGITPVMAIMATVLEEEPQSRFTLVYGNRDGASVMFAEEIADLKDRHPARLQVMHVLSQEPSDAELLHGRIDADKLDVLLASVVPPATVDQWYLCGPQGLVELVQTRLRRCVPPERVHVELFHVEGEPPRLARPPRSDGGTGTGACRVTVRLDGRSSTFSMPDVGSVLDATLAVRPEAPFACRGGVCGTCRARLVTGTVQMARTYALEPSELAAGYVLACQAVPTSDRLVLDYDA